MLVENGRQREERLGEKEEAACRGEHQEWCLKYRMAMARENSRWRRACVSCHMEASEEVAHTRGSTTCHNHSRSTTNGERELYLERYKKMTEANHRP